MLKSYLLLATALPLVQPVRLFLTNDDGWDEARVRFFFHALDRSSHQLILCAPKFANSQPPNNLLSPEEISDDESETDEPTSSDDEDLFSDSEPSRSDDDSDDGRSIFDRPIPVPSAAQRHRERWPWGYDPSDLRLNNVPFSPEGALVMGSTKLGPMLYRERDPIAPGIWNPHADLYLAGPKVGNSLGDERDRNRALTAIRQMVYNGISPGISFAGANMRRWPSDMPQQLLSTLIYAELANRVTETVIRTGRPFLPTYTYLHVNFPHVMEQRCNDVSQFRFILTSDAPNHRHWLGYPYCNREVFPFETDVVNRVDGCYVAVSIGNDRDPTRAYIAETNRKVIRKLRPILSCLPDT